MQLCQALYRGLSQLGMFDLDIRMNASQRFSIRVAFLPKAPACQSLAGRDLPTAGGFYFSQGKSSGLDLNAVPLGDLVS